jgi:hypothetical protein
VEVVALRLSKRGHEFELLIRRTFMKKASAVAALVGLALAVPVSANSRVKIDTVPSEYAPIESPTNSETVSLSSFHFEVNQETDRARVVAIYTYPDQMTYGPDDDAGGPRPTIVQLPGLSYDAAAHAVVYDSNGTKAVCATVAERAGLLRHHLKIKSTGACIVKTVLADHSEDTGWDIHRFSALDTYFEVH